MMRSNTTIAIPPGATIREQLENRGMTQKDFAHRMDMSEKHISNLINGKVELTQETALRLESVLGVPAKFWNGLEALYRERLARVKDELAMEDDVMLVSNFPYAKMVSLGWIPATQKKHEKVKNLRAFFEVAHLGILDDLKIPGIAYRKNGGNERSNYSLAVWAQKARLEARNISVKEINIAKLKENIDAIRALTVLDSENFCARLRELLAECGVAIVFLPHIDGSFLHGASFLDGNRIVLGLTVRGRDADRFWFSLFHELYHIIAGDISGLTYNSEERERKADEFARDTLIYPEDYAMFLNKGNFSKQNILSFAKEINVAAGIVLGRLQKENYVPYNRYHELKIQYQIV